MTARLHPRQAQILRYLQRYIEAHHFAPSVREIKEATGMSSAAVVDHHLERLARAGYIGRRRGVARGIWLPRGPDAGA